MSVADSASNSRSTVLTGFKDWKKIWFDNGMTYCKFISDIRIRFQFSIIRTAAMTPHEPPVFVLYRVFVSNVWIDDAPKIGIVQKRGGY